MVENINKKAIILTHAPIGEKDGVIIKRTGIFKAAINQHAGEYKPDIRIVSDYVVPDILVRYPEKIISVRQKMRCPSKRVEYFETEFKGSTMICAVEYLIYKGYDEILIVGDNRVNTKEFQDNVKQEIDNLKGQAKIYQYTDGNFNLPKKSIAEFCYV